MTVLMHKKIGETPLECLNRLRLEKPELQDAVLTYAGRLDPMADGLLLVLVGDECKRREEYLGLDKEYVCEVLWGASTDTYDILGKIVSVDESEKRLQKTPHDLQSFVGKKMQKFPPYSSKPVNGKPLHEWARANRLDEIEVPSKEVEIKSIEVMGDRVVIGKDLEKELIARLSTVRGDFRQGETIKGWADFCRKFSAENFLLSTLRISCSTGTYIRGLVDEIGKQNGVNAVVFSLTRTKIGDK